MEETRYIYTGSRAPENSSAMIVEEKVGMHTVFIWTGYVKGHFVKLYPRTPAAGRRMDNRARVPFTVSLDSLFERK